MGNNHSRVYFFGKFVLLLYDGLLLDVCPIKISAEEREKIDEK